MGPLPLPLHHSKHSITPSLTSLNHFGSYLRNIEPQEEEKRLLHEVEKLPIAILYMAQQGKNMRIIL